jgi:putative ABC transport system substrate-binding protein
MKSKRKLLIITLAVVVIGIIGLALIQYSKPIGKETVKKKKIGITQIASHPGLDELRAGVIAGLREKGWKENENLEILYRNANRDPNLTVPIAQYFIKERVDLIIPLTTPSTVAVVKNTSVIPIVFGAVTDPVGVGIMKNSDHPGGNVTGTSDIWPFKATIEFFQTILPNIKIIGMLYSPGDNVSEYGIKQMRQLSKQLNFTLVERPVSSASDVYTISRELFLKTDAIFTGMDNMIVENLESVLKAGFEANKPVLAGDNGSVQRGALAAMGIDQTRIGKETGYIAARVLNGESPGRIPVYTIDKGVPIINIKTAKRLNIKLPESILQNSQVAGDKE